MAEARTARAGDTVLVHYTGKLDTGQPFDSSVGREPFSFELGAGQVIPGFDEAIQGLEVGASRTVRLDVDDAYGQRREDLVLHVPADQAPGGLNAGDSVLLGGEQRALVVDVTDAEVVVDANHPLAGEALTFDLELVGIT
ncbi:MAG: peptidylprolyl isomerase [Acidimicrobiia bacterium]|nr:peptidylprolyl isomerase [Acidimicrobiia bacterium]